MGKYIEYCLLCGKEIPENEQDKEKCKLYCKECEEKKVTKHISKDDLQKSCENVLIIMYQNNNRLPSACDMCRNNPKNGGSGICFCTLGTHNYYLN